MARRHDFERKKESRPVRIVPGESFYCSAVN